MEYRIFRETVPYRERTVRLEWGNGKKMTVDPQHAVFCATGTMYDRQRCIVSFAAGLVRAGHQVLIYKKPIMWEWEAGWRQFYMPHLVGTVYHLYGHAFGAGQWDSLVRSLHTKIARPYWQEVYEETAQRCFDGLASPSSIVVPIRL